MFLGMPRVDMMRNEHSQTQELALERIVVGYHHIIALNLGFNGC